MVETEGYLRTNSNEEIYEDISKYMTSYDINTTFGTDFNLMLILQGLENLLQKFQEPNSKLQYADFENVLTSIIFLLKESKEDQDELIKRYAHVVVDNQNTTKLYPSLFKSLLCLFRLMDDKRPIKCTIYSALLKMIKNQQYLSYIDTDIKTLKNWFNLWRLTYDEVRVVVKQLYETLALCDKEEQGLTILNESLKLCQKEKMDLGKEDAKRSLILHIKNPKIFLFDHMNNIPLVSTLESEPIYQLFQIFLKMKLTNYMNFYEENKDFIEEIGLNHDDNVYKMRILTFMQLAADAKEIPFKKIVQELSLEPSDVEDFIINVVRSKMVRCKIDELGEKVVIDFAVNRLFDKERWAGLNSRLGDWIEALTGAHKHIQELVDIEGCDYSLEDLLNRAASLKQHSARAMLSTSNNTAPGSATANNIEEGRNNMADNFSGLGARGGEQSAYQQGHLAAPPQSQAPPHFKELDGGVERGDMLPPPHAQLGAGGAPYPPPPYHVGGAGGYYYPPYHHQHPSYPGPYPPYEVAPPVAPYYYGRPTYGPDEYNHPPGPMAPPLNEGLGGANAPYYSRQQRGEEGGPRQSGSDYFGGRQGRIGAEVEDYYHHHSNRQGPAPQYQQPYPPPPPDYYYK